ncbi:helix-turn-helix domain-containing protein [Anaerobranca gottschalkii]|uniref:Transcriptional regulator, contains XRE-family HTH domain n=1 Tax=Anaerobranca gottschalkii DSM 13577 TaxID=1120990 RepID=A0A1I0C4D8_9FIRM|nr:helix-turn-helix transcriptional regulator [Anaerobranca gottschalkii]SET14302.1 Transcriptional regulator, contains XRE-family HTH domain [Anaerobranca gottschalkii DSM 13577]
MSYNLKLFGEQLRQLRKKHKSTQSMISEKTGINKETLRKIENGKVVPRLDTLEALSIALKEDITELLLKCRLDDYTIFNNIKKKLESKLDNNEYEKLSTVLDEINKLNPSAISDYYKIQIEQISYFIEGAILYKVHNDPHSAYKKLINALIVSNEEFTIENYKDYTYSLTELRILMNIAFVINDLGNSTMYLEIMQFCFDNLNSDHPLYPKICHNLSTAYKRNNDYQNALKYTDLGINYCKKNKQFSGLHILYYGKGVIEYYLSNPEYVNSIKKAIFICELLDYNEIKIQIIERCKFFLKCDYDFENI